MQAPVSLFFEVEGFCFSLPGLGSQKADSRINDKETWRHRNKAQLLGWEIGKNLGCQSATEQTQWIYSSLKDKGCIPKLLL